MNGNLFDCARSMADLDVVLENLYGKGRRVQGALQYHGCPACGVSENGRHKVSSANGRWKCVKCGAEGSVVEALAYASDITPAEAAGRLTKGLVGAYVRLPSTVAEINASERLRLEALSTTLGVLRGACGAYRDDLACLSYLTRERKIPLEIVREAQARGMLGFLPGHPETAMRFLIDTIGQERLELSGLWRPGARKPGIAQRPIVSFFPGAKSAEFRMARQPANASERNTAKYGLSQAPWFWKGEDAANALVVVGVVDLLSAVALGFRGDIVGLPSRDDWKLEWFSRIKETRGTSVFVTMFEGDLSDRLSPVKDWAKALVDALNQAGMQSRSKPLQPATDVNGLLRSRAS